MSNTNLAYPFDPTGTAASNKVTADRQTISPPELSEFHFILPAAAPFFADTMKIIHLNTSRTLVKGVDYVPTHYFHDASLACAKPVYGSLTFYDATLAGAVEMEYQTLGGDWTLDSAKIIEILSNKLTNPRRVTWEQVANIPYQFPVIDHEWHLDDMVGASEIVDMLSRIRDAIYQSGEGGLQTHLADFNNPHNTTKAQVGLGSVQNYPVASIAEAQAGTAPNRYLTVERGAQMLSALIGTRLDDHINNSSNPHNTSKSQVGLSAVQNYGIATQLAAEQGTLDNLYMTPLRTKQALDAMVLTPLNQHLANINNPHNVTKAQVGLGSVQNYGIADAVAARLGTSNILYMTPAMTREAISAQATSGIADHLADTNNPHGVTKDQVGLGDVSNYAIATKVEAEEGLAHNKFMTPLRTREEIAALVLNDFTAHVNNSANPHGVTKTQVGLGNVQNYGTANDAQAAAGTATNLYLTPAGGRKLIEAMGAAGGGSIDAHLQDFDNPHQVTKEQVGLGLVLNYAVANAIEAAAGTANNLYLTPAGASALIEAGIRQELTSHTNDQNNPHQVTASQVGAYSKNEMDLLMLTKLSTTGKAADSTLFDGKTMAQVITAANPNVEFPAVRAELQPTWTKLGTITVNPNQLVSPQSDIVAEIVGGETSFMGHSPHYRVHLKTRAPAWSTVTLLTTYNDAATQFGYVYNSTTYVLELYIKSPAQRQILSVSVVSEPIEFFDPTAVPTTVEPADIQYITTVSQATGAASIPPPPVGQVIFGTTGTTKYEGAGLVEFVSVADSPADVVTAQGTAVPKADLFSSFIGYSASNTVHSDHRRDSENNWLYDTVGERLLSLVNEPEYAAWVSTTGHMNYTFEVEVGSATDDDMAVGVVAALVEENGRTYSISAVRTPGGSVTSGNGLFTVAYNLGQSDSSDLGSTSEGLTWGDGIADADRDGTPYTKTNWPEAGVCRIRVTRVGDTLTLETTDFGSTSYVDAAKVVLNLTSAAQLERFTGRTRYGFCQVQQERALVKPLVYPDGFAPVIERTSAAAMGVTYELLTYQYHNGVAWTTATAADVPQLAGRLIYSDWNGYLYMVTRNGRLRQIQPEAISRANPTFLTA